MPFFTASEVFGSGDLVEDVESAAGQTEDFLTSPVIEPQPDDTFLDLETPGLARDVAGQVKQEASEGAKAVGSGVSDIARDAGQAAGEAAGDAAEDITNSPLAWFIGLVVLLFALGTVVDVQTGGGKRGA